MRMASANISPDTSRDSSPDISVVIVTYNSGREVLSCLDSLSASTGPRLEVLVVDNNSTDEMVHRILLSYPDVNVLQMGTNRGFACAVNVGIRVAAADVILVLNPDTIVEPNTLATLLEFSKSHPSAGVVAPLLVYPDGSNQLTARSFPTAAAGMWGRRSPLTRVFPRNRWSSHFLVGRGTEPGDDAFRCDWVSGACMLVPKRAIERVGMLDERYFLFWEDADWCKRMADQGYAVWTVPLAVVSHSEGGSRRGWPAAVVKSFHRGAYLYWRTHAAPQWWNPMRWIAAVALCARSTALIAAHRLENTVRIPVAGGNRG